MMTDSDDDDGAFEELGKDDVDAFDDDDIEKASASASAPPTAAAAAADADSPPARSSPSSPTATKKKKKKAKSITTAGTDGAPLLSPGKPKKRKSTTKLNNTTGGGGGNGNGNDEEHGGGGEAVANPKSAAVKRKSSKKLVSNAGTRMKKSSTKSLKENGDTTTATKAKSVKRKSSKVKKADTDAKAEEEATQPAVVANLHENNIEEPSESIASGSASALSHSKKAVSRKLSHAMSILESGDDPFALRDGKTLLWRNVNMILKAKKDGDNDRLLLDNVYGEVPEQQTTAIMGPSGAGKTSLLNILAGRASSRGPLKIESDVRLNNFAVDPTNITVRKNIAFVAQDDSLQVTSTPRESIYFSAKLRLPRITPERHLIKLVNKMLSELGLTHCADTYVGGALLKGISGGERKRTSVGVELVVKPAMVFLDEPTSGLDSFSAVQLCQVLKKVANAGASVLFTIHQPASEIFNSFDRLILMNKGKVMFQGSVKDVPHYFKLRGHPCPPNYNPADWIMNVAQSFTKHQLEKDGFFPPDQRELPDPFTDHIEGKDELGITLTERHLNDDGYDDRPPSLIIQIQMLFKRELRNLYRDTASIGARFGLTIFLSLLIGVIFLDVGKSDSTNPSNLQSHFGALIMVLMMSMFGTAQPALLAFPEERPVFLREYSTNHYSVIAYFISRFTMEATITAIQIFVQLLLSYYLIGLQAGFIITFIFVYVLAMSSTAMAVMLGCAVEDPKLGQEMLPILFVPQMLFAGFFVIPELIPVWLRWASYLCSLTYAVRIALLEEFGADQCGPVDSQAQINCNNLLENVNAADDEKWWYWIILFVIFVCFRMLGLYILRQKATKFF